MPKKAKSAKDAKQQAHNHDQICENEFLKFEHVVSSVEDEDTVFSGTSDLELLAGISKVCACFVTGSFWSILKETLDQVRYVLSVGSRAMCWS